MKKKKWVFMVVMFMLLVSMSLPAQAASSKWKKACKAYRQYLAENQSWYVPKRISTWQYSSNTEASNTISDFLVADLDRNGVPELVAIHTYAMKNQVIYVFTYKHGRVVRVKGTDGRPSSIEALSYTGTGWPSIYTCNKRHLHIYLSWGSGNCEYTYVLKNGKLKCYTRYEWNWILSKSTYQINGKSVSAGKYESAVGNCKTKKCWVTNNATNRMKYVK